MTTQQKPTRLTPQQEQFAHFYALSGNAYESAIKAGYSKNTAKVHSGRMLDRVPIKDAVNRARVELMNKGEQLNITPEWIASQLADVAVNAEPGPRVAALRTLADIHGMLGGGQRELPAQATQLLEALGRGLAQGREKKPEAIEAPPPRDLTE